MAAKEVKFGADARQRLPLIGRELLVAVGLEIYNGKMRFATRFRHCQRGAVTDGDDALAVAERCGYGLEDRPQRLRKFS